MIPSQSFQTLSIIRRKIKVERFQVFEMAVEFYFLFQLFHFCYHREHTRQVSSRIQVTTSPDILDAMARGGGPETALVALGYAGWSAGQLENEIAQNAWLTVPADERILFETPYEQRWRAAGRLLGIDLATISPHVGHA